MTEAVVTGATKDEPKEVTESHQKGWLVALAAFMAAFFTVSCTLLVVFFFMTKRSGSIAPPPLDPLGIGSGKHPRGRTPTTHTHSTTTT